MVWCATGAACVVTVFAVAGAQDTPKSTPLPAATTKPSPAPVPTQNLQTAKLSPAVADVVRLVESGVNEEVVKSYVKNSATSYPLSADDILVLNQRGVPSEVIVAMLTRSGELRAQRVSAMAAAMPLPAPAQPGPVYAQSAPAYPAAQSAVYATEPAYPTTYNYYYPYPNYGYSYWNYPTYSSWWWTPSWGYYPYGHHHYPSYYNHGGNWAGYRQRHWADAYPNKLVAGPNWGADRGYNGWYHGRSGGWSGGYPSRVAAGPARGGNPGFSTRPVAYTGRVGGGFASAPRGGGGFQGPRMGGGGGGFARGGGGGGRR
jgi:hypothetical protein